MKIRILQGIEGARQATGVAVIIDVFRAFTVEVYAMAHQAEKILPVADVDFAYQYQKEHADVILIGERNGKKLPGFHYGNSPSEIDTVDFMGKTIVHTTSAGTQGIANAIHADVIVSGALVNAKAIANFILQNQYTDVSLVCMGLNGTIETEEDTLCAKYIQSLLEHKEIDISKEIEDLKYTSGAKFFDLEQTDFPMEDFAYCTRCNIFDFVLVLENGCMKRVNIK